jgi:sec-independent protein translocase protein TatA
MQMPGMSEWLIILLVVVLLFGGKKIPELMRGLGKGVREFKNASNETDEVKKEINEVASDLNKNASSKDQPKQ